MTYEQKLTDALETVKREGRYRVFADVKRRRGAFPKADVVKG
jgi:5-aminolevulinate synthase